MIAVTRDIGDIAITWDKGSQSLKKSLLSVAVCWGLPRHDLSTRYEEK